MFEIRLIYSSHTNQLNRQAWDEQTLKIKFPLLATFEFRKRSNFKRNRTTRSKLPPPHIGLKKASCPLSPLISSFSCHIFIEILFIFLQKDVIYPFFTLWKCRYFLNTFLFHLPLNYLKLFRNKKNQPFLNESLIDWSFTGPFWTPVGHWWYTSHLTRFFFLFHLRAK